MALDQDDIERLKGLFVQRTECEMNMTDVNKKLANDSTELAVIKTQLKMIIWILTAIGGGVLTTLVKLFFGV